MTPLTHPAKKVDQVDSEIKDKGQSYMFKKKFISKKMLIVKVAQNGTLDSSSQKIDLVDSEIKDEGQSYMFKEKFINQP